MTGKQKLSNFCLKENISFKQNISLKSFNTFRIESQASFFLEPLASQLDSLFSFLYKEKIDFLVLGGGSNLLLDSSIETPVIYYHGSRQSATKEIVLKKITSKGFSKFLLETPSYVSSLQVSKFSCEHNLKNLEFLFTIPGSIGGALVQNAGCYGLEMKDIIKSATVFTQNGKMHLSKKEMQLDYRSSIFKKRNWFISSLTFELSEFSEQQKYLCQKTIKEFREQRNNTQPKGKTAGSVFKNPANKKAWQVIEDCGLKNKNINDAVFSLKHSNFIINQGKAKSQDIYNLILLAQREAKEKLNISLQPEIVFWGNFKKT